MHVLTQSLRVARASLPLYRCPLSVKLKGYPQAHEDTSAAVLRVGIPPVAPMLALLQVFDCLKIV